MQGLGKPGVHQAQIAYTGMPKNIIAGGKDHMGTFENLVGTPAGERILKPHRGTPTAWGKQMVPKTLIEEAIKKGTVDFWGTGGHEEPTSDQYKKYTYPIPKEEGGTEIHMMWTDTPCRRPAGTAATTWSRPRETPRSSASWPSTPGWRTTASSPTSCCRPTPRSRSTTSLPASRRRQLPERRPHAEGHRARRRVQERLRGHRRGGQEARHGRSGHRGLLVEDLIHETYTGMRFDKIVAWEEFQEKDYFVIPVAKDWEKWPAGLYEFYKDPAGHPLPTPTGKLEFYSESLDKAFPNDEERPPYPQWIEKGITHDERISSKRALAYPLLVLSNHGRWRVHAQGDDIPWSKEALTGKVRGFDGYLYEPCWIIRRMPRPEVSRTATSCGSTTSAAACCAAPSCSKGSCPERSPSTTRRSSHPRQTGPRGSDQHHRSEGLVSRHAAGQATSGFLVEVERVTMAQMDEWMAKYPEAFAREYDPASGLRFNAWVEGGK